MGFPKDHDRGALSTPGNISKCCCWSSQWELHVAAARVSSIWAQFMVREILLACQPSIAIKINEANSHKDTSAVPSEMFLGPRTCHPYLASGPSVILVICCMGCNQPEVPEELENEDIRRHWRWYVLHADEESPPFSPWWNAAKCCGSGDQLRRASLLQNSLRRVLIIRDQVEEPWAKEEEEQYFAQPFSEGYLEMDYGDLHDT